MPTPPNPRILIRVGNPDPNETPLNLTQLFQLIERYTSGEIDGSYIPYIIQAGPPEPGVENQDYIWFQVDGQGRPIAIKKYWHGSWRRIYNGMLGEIRGFHGDPGYGPYPKNFNADGLGNATGEYDGWHLCNGKDGTPDMSDKFIIGAHMNNVEHPGYDDGEWQTWITNTEGQHTGGTRDFTLNAKNTYQPTTDIGTVRVGKYKIDAGGETLVETDFFLWGKPSASNEDKNLLLDVQSEGNPTPEAVSIINPFIALGWIIFVGYQS